MDNIQVSVIVPIYNVEMYLKKCLDSLSKQTLKDIEVLLINDGSTDNSPNIAKFYRDKFPNIFRYYEKVNGGLSDARNFAFQYVRGEYIMFVDSDDYVATSFCEKMLDMAIKHDANVVECEFSLIYDVRCKKDKIVKFPHYIDLKDYIMFAYPNAWNKIYKAKWLLDLNVRFPYGLWHEDIEFFFKIVPYIGKVPITIYEPLYFYRQRHGSIMSKPDRRILNLHDIYTNIYEYYTKKKLMLEYETVIEYKYLKTTCCSFFKRIMTIKGNSKYQLLCESWNHFIGKCPNWKSNIYLRKFNLINLYLVVVYPMLLFCVRNIQNTRK